MCQARRHVTRSVDLATASRHQERAATTFGVLPSGNLGAAISESVKTVPYLMK
jgi:hypothetical protein